MRRFGFLLLAAPLTTGPLAAQLPDSMPVAGERVRVEWSTAQVTGTLVERSGDLHGPGAPGDRPAEAGAAAMAGPDCQPGSQPRNQPGSRRGGPEDLRAFGALAVGEWVGDDSRHVFAWAEDSTVIRSTSFFPADTGWTPVSTGCWWWDRVAGTLRGEVHARDMPFDRMEYRSEVERRRVVHAVRTHGDRTEEFVEIWTFEGETYRWALYPPGRLDQPIMEGRYRRIPD